MHQLRLCDGYWTQVPHSLKADESAVGLSQTVSGRVRTQRSPLLVLWDINAEEIRIKMGCLRALALDLGLVEAVTDRTGK